jgi:hypothetical protein
MMEHMAEMQKRMAEMMGQPLKPSDAGREKDTIEPVLLDFP